MVDTGDPRRWWALGALLLAVLTVGFDITILNVALPTLARELDATGSQLQWIVDSYVLVFAGLLLPAGALGDRFECGLSFLFMLVEAGLDAGNAERLEFLAYAFHIGIPFNSGCTAPQESVCGVKIRHACQ